MKRKITAILLVVALALSLGLVPAASVRADPGPGIVGLWHLDDGSGTTATDDSGNGNDGTLKGAFGTALSFDGINDYVQVPDSASLDITGSITLEAWIKPIAIPPTGDSMIISKWNHGTAQRSYILFMRDKKLSLHLSLDGTSYMLLQSTDMTSYISKWVHVAGTFDGTTAKLYIDGVDQSISSSTTGIYASTAPLYIGSYLPTDLRTFKGFIDEIRISNVARTSFNLGAPPSADANTVGLWHFNEGSGQTAGDSAGSNQGQLGSTGGSDGNDPIWVPSVPQWVSDQWGGYALDFDGTDDYVEVPDSPSLDITGDLTIEAWVKFDSYTSPHSMVIAKDATGQRSYALFVDGGYYGKTGKVCLIVFSASSYSMHWGNTMLTTGVWHHIAGTYDYQTNGTSVMKIFVDGVLDSTPITNAVGPIYSGSADLQIGARQYPPSPSYNWRCFVDGMIDEVRIWDTATPSFNLDVTPETDFNPVDTDHTITATVTIDKVGGGTELAPGVEVNFEVIDGDSPNEGDSSSGYTDSNGQAAFTYMGDSGAGMDTVTVSIDQDCYQQVAVDVTKYWLENFVTGGGKINTTSGKGNKAAYTFAGTVGVLEGVGIVGQFQIVDHTGKGAEAWHCNNFSFLNFTGAPAESPVATNDTAIFTGAFTSDRGGSETVTVTIVDNGEPGAGVDTITFDGFTLTIDGGNFQVHDYE